MSCKKPNSVQDKAACCASALQVLCKRPGRYLQPGPFQTLLHSHQEACLLSRVCIDLEVEVPKVLPRAGQTVPKPYPSAVQALCKRCASAVQAVCKRVQFACKPRYYACLLCGVLHILCCQKSAQVSPCIILKGQKQKKRAKKQGSTKSPESEKEG